MLRFKYTSTIRSINFCHKVYNKEEPIGSDLIGYLLFNNFYSFQCQRVIQRLKVHNSTANM